MGVFNIARPATWNYVDRYWGHDYVYHPQGKEGLTARMQGWGYDIEAGDYLILPANDGAATRYRVDTIQYYSDPEDMWSAIVHFAPRDEEQR